MSLVSRIVALALAICSVEAIAGSLVAPSAADVKYLAAAPAWLKNGTGDDGYVTVDAKIIMPGACQNLGGSGWISKLKNEQLQIVASLRTKGFRSNLDDRVLPIATFDSRTGGAGCVGLNSLPLRIISSARLEPFSPATAGNLTIIFDVKSTTDTKLNLIAPAQFALGAAAVFATGGAATTVAGLTTKLAEPALKSMEQKMEKAMDSAVGAQAPVTLSWPEIRKGIKTITTTVYGGKTRLGESDKAAVDRIRAAKTEDSKLFDIELTFTYSKTLFDPSVSGAEDLPKIDSISKIRVLSYPNWDGLVGMTNFLQVLNGNSPSLLQSMSAADSSQAQAASCGAGIEILRNAGLNELDRAIVMESFVDEAKEGPDWYASANINSCFRDYLRIKALVVKLYGNGGPSFTVRDTQSGDGEEYRAWKANVPPVLVGLRQALTTTEAKAAVLTSFNRNADMQVQIYPNSNEWTGTVPAIDGSVPVAPDASLAKLPGIAKLAAKPLTKAGCFVYGEESNMVAGTMGAHMILVGAQEGDYWHAEVALANSGTGKVSVIKLSRLDASWIDHFKRQTYNGGECANILKSLPV